MNVSNVEGRAIGLMNAEIMAEEGDVIEVLEEAQTAKEG